MKTFRFLDFSVYKDAKKFCGLVVKICKKFPQNFSFLAHQLVRSATSIALNIAEGSAKKSDKDFNRYVENALGSVSESVSVLDIASDNNIVAFSDFQEANNLAEKIARQLGGLSKKLRSKN